jgi:bifunctional DNA-binding transcriptional regulator/antitoxin component of YhaV-PrlF toxin-antitoxin module
MVTKTIQKATSRGQITLPARWRERFNTNNYIVEAEESFLRIIPFDIEDAAGYEVIFDADRDNGGKGILGRDIIKAIQEIGG